MEKGTIEQPERHKPSGIDFQGLDSDSQASNIRHVNIWQEYLSKQDLSMSTSNQAEFDAKIQAIEAHMDARVARIEGKIDSFLTAVSAEIKLTHCAGIKETHLG